MCVLGAGGAGGGGGGGSGRVRNWEDMHVSEGSKIEILYSESPVATLTPAVVSTR